MKNYKVSQQYPDSKNNNFTLKLMYQPNLSGCLTGFWFLTLNEVVLESEEVVDNESLDNINEKYEILCESLHLTNVCSSYFNLSNF